MKCPGCGADLPSVARKNPLYAKVSGERPKAAVFDLDGTVFDTFQRFKDARRAGLVDKDGKPVAKGMMSKGKAWQKRNKFLYSKKNLAKDKLIPGAKELISQLSTDGYIIIYLTARPKEYYTEILGQLESNGLPLYRDSTDRVMLITKPGGGPSATKYKGNEIRQLQGEFTVEMLFDDEREVLEEASKYGVPGLYTSVSDHVKTNPGTRDPDAAPYDVAQSGPMGDRVFVDDEEEITVVSPRTMQTKLDAFTEMVKGGKTNPDTSDYREAAGTIIMEGDKVLLLRRSTKETSRHGMWELPGGKLEEGETAEEAAINEAKEETGLDVVIAKSAGKHVDHNMHKVYHGFIAEPVNVNQEIKLSEEHDESLWVTLEEALAMEEGKLSHHARELFSKMTVMKNPAKRGKDSKGPYYRWGGGKKFYYTAGSKKSREAARKKAYGQAKADLLTATSELGRNFLARNPEIATTFPYDKLTPKEEEIFDASLGDSTLVKISSDKISIKATYGKTGTIKSKFTFKQIKDPSKVMTVLDTYRQGFNPMFIGEIEKIEGKGKSLIVEGWFNDGNRTFHKHGPHPLSDMAYEFMEKNGVKYGEVSFDDIGYTVSQICQDKDGFYLWDGKEALRFKSIESQGRFLRTGEDIAFLKDYGVISNPFGLSLFGGKKSKDFSATIQYPTIALVRETPRSSIKIMLIHYTGTVSDNPPKKNPANPKKVQKGKKLYKHMNGQDPEKVKVEKVDIGDVWYKVGEGGCWQIGYMSGKETGKDDQKYIHTFNEETQDGDFPELYATMPESGKPMLIIKGGTWKIKTDDKGVAWIYD